MSTTASGETPAEGSDTASELDAIDEKIARSGIPAIYIDTWFVTTWRGHMRITFGETVAGIDAYRNAIVLELPDAEKLAQLMLRMIDRRKARTAPTAISESPEASET